MARARNIKPGLFKNEILVEMDPAARLLFIGLWTLADREGRIEDRPKRIKLELLPFDDVNVDEMLNQLAEGGFINRYQANEVKVIEVCNFLKHQNPHGTEKDSELPDSEGNLTVHERSKNGCVTGNKRAVNVKNNKNNVNSPLGHSEETVNTLLDNALNPESRILNPDSLNPESRILNPESKQAAEKCELPKQKKQTQAKPARFDPRSIDLPECVKPSAWEAWIEYRLARRLTCAEPTIKAQAKNLDEWWHEGHDPNAIIRASIANGWQGLFPPKSTAPPQPVDDGLEANRRLAEMAVKRLNLVGD